MFSQINYSIVSSIKSKVEEVKVKEYWLLSTYANLDKKKKEKISKFCCCLIITIYKWCPCKKNGSIGCTNYGIQ